MISMSFIAWDEVRTIFVTGMDGMGWGGGEVRARGLLHRYVTIKYVHLLSKYISTSCITKIISKFSSPLLRFEVVNRSTFSRFTFFAYLTN